MDVQIITQIINTHPINSYTIYINEPLPTDLLLPSFHKFSLEQYQIKNNQSYSMTLLDQSNINWSISSSICSSLSSLPLNISYLCNERSEYSTLSSLQIKNIHIPPNSIFTFIFPYQKRFLSRSYQPTDASRGGDIPSSIIFYHENKNKNQKESMREQKEQKEKEDEKYISDEIEWKVYITQSWMITMFFPDASMPFNVIIMVNSFYHNFFDYLFMILMIG